MRMYLDYQPEVDDDEDTVVLLEEFRNEFNKTIRLNATNSLLTERIGPKISEANAASIIRNKKRKKAQQEDYMIRRYFKDV